VVSLEYVVGLVLSLLLLVYLGYALMKPERF
jgi:K+-transporting ATPase KdpF subunit